MIELTSDALAYAQEHGAEYVEVRGETTEFLEVVAHAKGIMNTSGGIYNGLGVRAFYGSGRGYSSTSFITKTSVERAVEEAVRMAKASNFGGLRPEPLQGRVENVKEPYALDPREQEVEDKARKVLQLAKQLSKALNAPHISVRYLEKFEDRTVATNYGLRLRYTKPSIYLSFWTSSDPFLNYEDGLTGGWEVFSTLKKRALEFSSLVSEAEPGNVESSLPVVLSGRATAQLLLDWILPSYVLPDWGGPRIGSEVPLTRGLRIVDDPKEPSAYGRIPFDDEGVPSEPILLVQDGKLTAKLNTRSFHEKGGRARAQDFVHEAAPAPTTTIVDAGELSDPPLEFAYVPFLSNVAPAAPGNASPVAPHVFLSPLTLVYKGSKIHNAGPIAFSIDSQSARLAAVSTPWDEASSRGCIRPYGGGQVGCARKAPAALLGGARLD
ncbi:MAG: metallopeptidase TldD-related protein [Thermoprotei archaeon]|nr:metallopeptidase TldD-related protein [TACK group archaeon]